MNIEMRANVAEFEKSIGNEYIEMRENVAEFEMSIEMRESVAECEMNENESERC